MSAIGQEDAAQPVVDICICTFRRTSLRATLESLATQEGAQGFRVIVADNDETPSAETLVTEAGKMLNLDIRYLHAPARNISVARNACLDAATGPLVAFIDDDEIASPGWLKAMIGGLGELDVVFGPVQARYPANAPDWAVQGDFHSFGPAIRANGKIDTGYSSNTLFRREIIGSLRFDPALGRTGGEDTFFFARLHQAGVRLGFCGAGVVFEPTAPERVNLGWLVRRAFRSGQTHAQVLKARGEGALAVAAIAGGKALYCGVGALATLWSPVRWRRLLLRAALHAGVAAKAFGVRDVEIYGGS